jgi:hypothetical protein
LLAVLDRDNCHRHLYGCPGAVTGGGRVAHFSQPFERE